MNCDFCKEEQAVLMVSDMSNGDTQAVGPACLPFFVRAMAQEMGVCGDQPAPTDGQGEPADAGSKPTKAAARGGRRRKPADKAAQSVQGDPTADPGDGGTPEPAEAVSGPPVDPAAAHAELQQVTGGQP